VRVAIAAALLAISSGLALGQNLTQKVQGVIAGSKLGSAKVGVSVRDLDTGNEVVDIGGDTPMKPASNLKLLTSGTALVVLGPEFAFKTELIVDGAPGAERLIIRGSGDPALADPAVLERMTDRMTVESLLERLAGAVKQAGIARLAEVVVDDRVFDREWVHPSWPKDQLDKWYCAPICGLNFHTNTLSVFPSPSSDGPGRHPVIQLEPSLPWIEIENKAQTVSAGKNSAWLARAGAAEGNRFTLFGDVKQPTRQPIEITLNDVPTVTGQLFAAELARLGIGVGGTGREAAIKSVRLIGENEKYAGRTVGVVSTHMTDILSRCNGDSHNLYAEALLKRVGREVTGEPGSWTNGSSVVRMTIGQASKLGPKYAASTVVVDGSGLSKDNRVTPSTFTRWLDEMLKDRRIGSVFVGSLATADERGNLRRRFQDTKLTCDLAAKTGTIAGVRCLSGYLTEPRSGRRVAFSIMINDINEARGEVPAALDCQEKVVAAIDRWLGVATANVPENTR
jgi:serine-type D-Ala-D-Ala carboxypeptidase/endopeptidase (penicillin-binding protein 4)